MKLSLRTIPFALAILLAAAPALADTDGDGFDEPEDCDDGDALIHPGAPEYCDGVDNDCDLLFDVEDVDDFVGVDGDADGDPANACGGEDCDDRDPLVQGLDADGDGYSLCSTVPDCDDTDAAASPDNAVEVCGDGIDNECSGTAEDLDADGDGAFAVECGGDDCNDGNPVISPLAGETGTACIDLIDNDCDCTGDTDGDGIVCGQGDAGVDGLDVDCQVAPVPDAGADQQDRYLGGFSVVVLDGSATTDDNKDDVLVYTWAVTPRQDYSGIDWTLEGDPSAPYGYLRFHADPGAPDTTWVFDATLTVDDLTDATPDPPEAVTVMVSFFRPTFVSEIGCEVAGGAGAGLSALLLASLALVGLRRR